MTPVSVEIDDLGWTPAGLSGVTLHVPPGQIVGLLGPNGSGKSSLLRCVYRSLRPDTGTVRVDGADVWRTPARNVARQVAVLTQDAPTDLDNTAEQIVALGRIPHQGRFGGLSPTEHRLIDDAIRRCDIAHLAHRSMATLSGGERQRVQLARALVQEPRLLILDEPTNHLDLRHQVDLLRLIAGLDVTALIALHDLQLAAAACHRLVVLNEGRIVADGAPTDVVTADLLRDVYQVDADVDIGPDGLPRVAVRLHDVTTLSEAARTASVASPDG
ncbi:ABC transporter ATP-binding protein [Thermomonospora umbrina]|uniref:Iron complex transport system ATP-binding protein n=1 Tax=Thermomonospora umbrina TaxID=111806 RepID=A0A3D9T8S2_9ACTN|nr:ABC transporter ATP-binding protein [Thermomonospora umbrina]REF01055.1 iron complex transport system ATP-binding protein [Thermomonospora umbrina]